MLYLEVERVSWTRHPNPAAPPASTPSLPSAPAPSARSAASPESPARSTKLRHKIPRHPRNPLRKNNLSLPKKFPQFPDIASQHHVRTSHLHFPKVPTPVPGPGHAQPVIILLYGIHRRPAPSPPCPPATGHVLIESNRNWKGRPPQHWRAFLLLTQ